MSPQLVPVAVRALAGSVWAGETPASGQDGGTMVPPDINRRHRQGVRRPPGHARRRSGRTPGTAPGPPVLLASPGAPPARDSHGVGPGRRPGSGHLARLAQIRYGAELVLYPSSGGDHPCLGAAARLADRRPPRARDRWPHPNADEPATAGRDVAAAASRSGQRLGLNGASAPNGPPRFRQAASASATRCRWRAHRRRRAAARAC